MKAALRLVSFPLNNTANFLGGSQVGKAVPCLWMG